MVDTERRHHQRVPFIATIAISLNGQHWNCELEDISIKGFLIQAPKDVQPQLSSRYGISLVLGEDTEINMQAKISHTKDNHWGFLWENIDVTSLSHLRRLMELNSQDPDSINRELSELG